MEQKNIPLETKTSDRIICSFPRSGNTWVRRLISDVVLQISGFETPGDEESINIESIIPMYEPYKVDPRIKLKHRLIKSHSCYSKGFKTAVYILRRPEDVFVSYFYHKKYQTGMSPAEGIDRFCLNRIHSWSVHVESWLQAKTSGNADVFMCIYEKLHAESVAVLSRLVRFLELDASPTMVKQAVENQHFHRLQQKEKEKKPGKDSLFFRKGKIGGYKQEIREETFNEIREHTDPLYRKALRMFFSDVTSSY